MNKKNRNDASYHPATGYGGRRSVVDVVRLEDDLAIGRHGQPVAVGQRQRPVIIQHRVEILDPQRVHRSIQHQPNVFSLLGFQRLPPQSRKNPVLNTTIFKPN